jgi:integrase
MHARRATPLSCGNRPGTINVNMPLRAPRDYYTNASFGRACQKVFPLPAHLASIRVKGKKGKRRETNDEWKARLGPENWRELKRWIKESHWRPHQLRHATGTHIRRERGVEAAQLALGHSSALVTDAVYAERDMEKFIAIMRELG